jgi:chorismate mutase/prephenate dehydratase
MEGIKRICAHSQALAQCQSWLNEHYPTIERQAVASNGEAAKIATDDHSAAAIAGEMAAKRYGLSIVHANIQDDPHNRTRFVVIGRLIPLACGKDQTSIVLSVPNKPGAVYELLAPLAKHSVSMTRFESRPARTGRWDYYFYVDIQGHANDPTVSKALAELQTQAAFFKVLGSYPHAS